jgi:hypothetical protein
MIRCSELSSCDCRLSNYTHFLTTFVLIENRRAHRFSRRGDFPGLLAGVLSFFRNCDMYGHAVHFRMLSIADCAEVVF